MAFDVSLKDVNNNSKQILDLEKNELKVSSLKTAERTPLFAVIMRSKLGDIIFSKFSQWKTPVSF